MSIGRMSVVALLAAIVTLGFSSASPAAEKAGDFTGTWKWSAQRANATSEVTAKLKQEGEKVTGTMTGQNNQDVEIKEGKVTNGELSFKTVRDRNGTQVTTTYTGKMEGESIKGKIETTGGATTRPARDWTATRAKADAAVPAPAAQ